MRRIVSGLFTSGLFFWACYIGAMADQVINAAKDQTLWLIGIWPGLIAWWWASDKKLEGTAADDL